MQQLEQCLPDSSHAAAHTIGMLLFGSEEGQRLTSAAWQPDAPQLHKPARALQHKHALKPRW